MNEEHYTETEIEDIVINKMANNKNILNLNKPLLITNLNLLTSYFLLIFFIFLVKITFLIL